VVDWFNGVREADSGNGPTNASVDGIASAAAAADDSPLPSLVSFNTQVVYDEGCMVLTSEADTLTCEGQYKGVIVGV